MLSRKFGYITPGEMYYDYYKSDTIRVISVIVTFLESVGLTESKLVMGKHSGRHAFRQKLEELGYELGDNAVQDAFKRFKDLADLKKDIFDEDIIALVDDAVVRSNDRIQLVSLEVLCGTEHRPPSAKLRLNFDGDEKYSETTGDGPVDAIFT